MRTGFQEQVPTSIQVSPPPHAPRNVQWQLVKAKAKGRTMSRLKESETGPACPWLSGTWFSFVNPDLICPCNTGFITSLAGTCIWLDWTSTASICFSNPFSQRGTLVILEQEQTKLTKNAQGHFAVGNYFILCFAQKGLTKSLPQETSLPAVLHSLPAKPKGHKDFKCEVTANIFVQEVLFSLIWKT